MKKILLLLTVVCMYKTSVNADPCKHKMYKAATWGRPWEIPTETSTPASIPYDVVNRSLSEITGNVNNLKRLLKAELKKQESQGCLALFQLNKPDVLIEYLVTLELVKIALNRKESWGNSKKEVADKANVIKALTTEIDRQDYNNLVTILEDNKAYRLSCIEKLRLVERARAYNILNDFKTECSIKLRFKHSDGDKKPDSSIVAQRETSTNIIQLLQVKLYRSKKR
jgi:hypothetical protein